MTSTEDPGSLVRLECAPIPAGLEDVIATSVLFDRKTRTADYRAENDALASLMEAMKQTPDVILQKLADTALTLCEAESAGISIAEVEAGAEIFRWRATAGKYTEYLGRTMPRHFSPCGAVIERDAPILMIDMVKYYDYVSFLNAPPHEVLLVPFHHEGKPVGKVWVVSHGDARKFDSEDLRILRSLTKFASVAMQVFTKTNELEKANATALATVETREQFIAVLGHDLRNPLGAILNGAQMLERGVQPGRATQLGQIIGKSAHRIDELIGNLLDLARGRLGGGISLKKELCETLEPALEHVVSELESISAGKTVDAEYAFATPVDVDVARISQMVSNLVGNALSHGAADTPVRLQAFSSDDRLVISVSNSGVPIRPDIMERLFKPFERGSDGNQSGLGLGLYISAEIARAHGGELTVQSTEDQTTFRFTMPLHMPIVPSDAYVEA